MMIKFSLPGYITHESIIKYFVWLQEEYPQCFIEGRLIDSSYDMPGDLIWNGGRVLFNQNLPKEELYPLIDSYKNTSLKLRHTCTNMLITEELLYDYLCNQFVSYTESSKNAIIVHSELLANYIKKEYPKYNIIWSTTRRDTDFETINKLSETDLLVLDYQYNQNEEALQKLQHPHNIEILCAENCIFNCPNRLKHYASLSRLSLQIPGAKELQCPYQKDHPSNFYYHTLKNKHAITNEYIDYLYNTYNIQNFKISGRTNPPYMLIEGILYYLIKPEYRDIIRQEALYRVYEQVIFD